MGETQPGTATVKVAAVAVPVIDVSSVMNIQSVPSNMSMLAANGVAKNGQKKGPRN